MFVVYGPYMKKLCNLTTRLASNLFAILLGTGIALLLGEGFVRYFTPCPDYGGGIRPAFYSNLFEYDPELGWKGVPNLHTPYNSKDFRIHVSHDGYGYRNISPPHVPGKDNFLLLGDSFAWGWGVEDDETAAAIVNHEDSTTNLYSLGLAGYGTDQAWLALQRHLHSHPANHYRGVILLFYFNDFDDNASTERYGYPKPAFQLMAGQLQLTNVPVPHKAVPQDIPVSFVPEPNDWTSSIQLLNFLAPRLLRWLAQQNREKTAEPPTLVSQQMQHKIGLSLELLGGLARYCRENNLPFHVVLLQTLDTQEENLAALQHLDVLLTEQGLAHSVFRSRKFPSTDLWLDAHFSPYGQVRLAKHLMALLTSMKTGGNGQMEEQ